MSFKGNGLTLFGRTDEAARPSHHTQQRLARVNSGRADIASMRPACGLVRPGVSCPQTHAQWAWEA